MAISDKNRKLLWARSGNRCAMCQCEITLDATSVDAHSVVGDECHIISTEKNGPRYVDPHPFEDMDCYQNLLLLCKTHHKLVDDQRNTWTANDLTNLKAKHEAWVKERLTPENPGDPKTKWLQRVTTGEELISMIEGSLAYDFTHDSLKTAEEVSLVSSFSQNLQDCEILGDIGAGEKVKAAFSLTQEMEALEEAGFWVFASCQKSKFKVKDQVVLDNWFVFSCRVVRKGNPDVFTVPIG